MKMYLQAPIQCSHDGILSYENIIKFEASEANIFIKLFNPHHEGRAGL